MTRTFWFWEMDDGFRRVYDVVLAANAAAHEAAVLGNAMQEVDRAARRVITKAGYGEYFVHRTGHGVGIDVHESPNAAEGETAELRPGMAFSIEPGIYLPGRFGVRIEDLVLMNEARANSERWEERAGSRAERCADGTNECGKMRNFWLNCSLSRKRGRS